MILAHGDGAAAGPWVEELATLAAAAAALLAYSWLSRPLPGRTRSRRSRNRLWCWRGAIVSIAAMQLPPMDEWVESSFAAHMVQHIVLLAVSAPLIVLARPGAVLASGLRSTGWRPGAVERLQRAGSVLVSPALCWAVVVGYVWAVHFSAVYDLALRDDAVHLLEHLGFLAAGVMAWLPVLGPKHLAVPDPLKVLYVLVLMPALTFCGVALFSADHPLYSSYASQPGALDDQRLGGMLMWVLPGVALLPLGLLLVVRWWRREDQAAALADRAASDEVVITGWSRSPDRP